MTPFAPLHYWACAGGASTRRVHEAGSAQLAIGYRPTGEIYTKRRKT